MFAESSHREILGNGKLEQTLKKVTKILNREGIPFLVGGGFAVQEYGYVRFTSDLDLIVHDIDAVVAILVLNGFRKDTRAIVTYKATNVQIDFLPAGRAYQNHPVPFPVPHGICKQPQILDLEDLISLKLSSYKARGLKRAKDLADVSELIQRNHLPRDFKVDFKIKEMYQKLWDELEATNEEEDEDLLPSERHQKRVYTKAAEYLQNGSIQKVLDLFCD